MVISKDRIGGFFLLIFCLVYGYLSQKIVLLPFQAQAAFHARTMPEVLAVLGVSLSVLVIMFPGSDDKPQLRGYHWGLGIAFLLLMSAYGFSIRPLGFIISTSSFLMIGFWMLGERSIARLLCVGVPIVMAFWLLMTQGLDVVINPLPVFWTEQ